MLFLHVASNPNEPAKNSSSPAETSAVAQGAEDGAEQASEGTNESSVSPKIQPYLPSPSQYFWQLLVVYVVQNLTSSRCPVQLDHRSPV